jgi:HEAT repeat protein
MHRILGLSFILLSVGACAGEDMSVMAMEQRQRVIDHLGELKVPADIATSIGDLALNDVPTRESAAALLIKHAERKAVVSALITAAREDDPDKRPNAASILVTMGPSVLPELEAALEKNETRARAAWAISEMGDNARPALPALVKLLQSDDIFAVNDAATALAKMGSAAHGCIDAMLDAMKCPDQDARAAIAQAIKQAGPTAENIPRMIPLLKDRFMKVRSTIILAFGYMGDAAKPTIPVLIEHLKDENSWCRMHAAAALARFGPAAAEAEAPLTAALSDEAGTVRGAAANALARICPSPRIVPDLIAAVQDENERVRHLASEALVLVGKPALEDLRGASEASDDAKLKTLLAELIQKIETN